MTTTDNNNPVQIAVLSNDQQNYVDCYYAALIEIEAEQWLPTILDIEYNRLGANNSLMPH